MANVIEVFVGLLLAVAGLSLLARRLQVPYPVLLVAGGLLLSLIPRLARLQEIEKAEPAKQDSLQRLRTEHEDRVRQLEVCTPSNGHEPQRLFSAEYEQLSHEALQVERRMILRRRNERVINAHVHRRIQRDID